MGKPKKVNTGWKKQKKRNKLIKKIEPLKMEIELYERIYKEMHEQFVYTPPKGIRPKDKEEIDILRKELNVLEVELQKIR